LKRFIYLFIVFFISLPIFSTNSSPLIGDLTKDELFLKDNNFYKNYLSTEPYEFNEIIDLEGISVRVLFGTWCHDSQREIPKLLRMLEDINLKPEKISLIGP
jgi:hypothetical protein